MGLSLGRWLGTRSSRTLAALRHSTPCIEFNVSGKILDVNDLFLNATGYTRKEVLGKHHSMFLPSGAVHSAHYEAFWRDLALGRPQSGVFHRIGKQGNDIWIEAVYTPVMNPLGNVSRIIKFASDTTERKQKESINESLLAATERSFATISFALDGTILEANDNFLATLGYQRDEIIGHHHSIFVDPDESNSPEYELFWQELRAGHFQRGQFKRIHRSGSEVWIEASYNPVIDPSGHITKIVKYAIDVSETTRRRIQAESISVAISASSSQFTQTINEINVNVNRTASLSSEARSLTEEARNAVSNLEKSSKVIGNVTNVIKDLAEQTNLLALNANLEAARAGREGRGFSVVANSVKALANQTSLATKDIESTVNEIQGYINLVVGSTDEISTSIEEVNCRMNVIAAAVEEQSVTMQSICNTVTELRELSRV